MDGDDQEGAVEISISDDEVPSRPVRKQPSLSGSPNVHSWDSASPEDAFVTVFSLLSYKDLNCVATVCKAWKEVSYTGALWQRLDLSHMWWKVDDRLVKDLLSSRRFGQVRYISLENCLEVTRASLLLIARHCPDLRVLMLTNCHKISPIAILELLRDVPLNGLELWGVPNNVASLQVIKHLRPALRMPLFWKACCSHLVLDEATGMPVGLDRCRHAEPFAARACWGTMLGRLVFDNTFYHLPGNYPREVLYSCQLHHDADLADEHLFSCQVCSRLFRRASMWADDDDEAARPLICRHCLDRENMRDPDNWLRLDKKSIANFGMGHVLSKAVTLANSKNLPFSLTEYGANEFNLSYIVPGDLDQAAGRPPVERGAVPIQLFMQANAGSVDVTVDAIKTQLQEARAAGQTRALLVFGEDRSLRVLADAHPIVDGLRGESYLMLAAQAWHNASLVIYPFAAAFLIVGAFLFATSAGAGVLNNKNSAYTANLDASRQQTVSPEYILVMLGSFVVMLGLGTFLAIRFRQFCLKALYLFVFVDLLFLYVLGCTILFGAVVELVRLPIEVFTGAIFVWNIGAVGIYALYFQCSPRLHRLALFGLFTLMAVMMVGTLHEFILLFFVLLYAVGDLVSALRPGFTLLSPFIAPPQTQDRGPRILFPANGLCLRSVDILWYGLLLGLVQPTFVSLLSAGVFCLSSIVVCVFVCPVFGYKDTCRPPVFGLLAMLLVILVWEAPINNFAEQFSALTRTATVVGPPRFVQA